jgi:hypothetical protein
MGFHCSVCKQAITEGVRQYSMSRCGKALCAGHQKIAQPEKSYVCSECNQPITYGEFKFSVKHFDKPLCRDCRPEEEEKVSAAPRKFQGMYKIEVNESASNKKALE